MAPRTKFGWASAIGVLAVTTALALVLWRFLALLPGYPAPALQTSEENDGYEITLVFSVLLGLMMLTAEALTALVLWLHRRTDRWSGSKGGA